MAIRVLLVDDHALFRQGLAALFATREGWEVVGEAEDGLQALELVRKTRPDLVLMDIKMPGVDGLAATRAITTEMPETKVVMLTVSEEDEDLFAAIESGAQGYLLKSLEAEDFFGMLESLAAGEAVISPSLAWRILSAMRESGAGARSPEESLTPREQQVLEQLVQGATNREIAAALSISEHTVKFHLRNVLQKLHLKNRAQVVAYALRHGLVSAEADVGSRPPGFSAGAPSEET